MARAKDPEIHKIHFHFYGDLKRFLSLKRPSRSFTYSVKGRPTVKDTIEALGVPHTEVDAIMVNGAPADFGYQFTGNVRVQVYPDVLRSRRKDLKKLKPKIPANPKFVLDVHLGKLCRHLRLLGFDTLYDTGYTDQQLMHIGINEKRLLLTRDIGLLKNKRIYIGYFIRHTDPKKQIKETIEHFQLHEKIKPFILCIDCNGRLKNVSKANIIDLLPLMVKKFYREFRRCQSCGKIYWKGSHYDHLERVIKTVVAK